MHVKCLCRHCGERFYDVGQHSCSYCQKPYDPLWMYRVKKTKTEEAKPAPATPASGGDDPFEDTV